MKRVEENSMGLMGYCPDCQRMQASGLNVNKCKVCKGAFIRGSVMDSGVWYGYSAKEQESVIDAFLKGEDVATVFNKQMREQVENYITTSNGFEGKVIEEYCGTVFGTDIYLVGGLVGGGLTNQEQLFGTAFANAKKKMFDKAKEVGANAVIGMQTTVTSPGGINNIIVVTTGTAVKLR